MIQINRFLKDMSNPAKRPHFFEPPCVDLMKLNAYNHVSYRYDSIFTKPKNVLEIGT